MLVLIKLTSAGADAGPFNLYSNVDGFVTPFATGISKSILLTGYLTNVVPNGTTVVRCVSTGTCTNYVDFNVTTGLTTTTTTTIAGTTTTTTTSGGGTTSTTTTGGPSVLTKIRVTDGPAGSAPVQCDGTIPPTQGTTVSRYTTVSLLDQYDNLINAPYNITASINYIYDPCYSTPINSPINFLISTGQSTSPTVYTYAASTLVDCGQSNCEIETITFDAPISNTASLPFVVNIIP